MECTIAALIACFNWSNFYFDGSLIYNDINYIEINPTTLEIAAVERNPFGAAAIGYEMRFRNVTLSFEAVHVSSLQTNEDRGVNSLQFQARWYPFR
jgi:hypothetical protein